MLTGTKLLRDTDFETADARITVGRSYRSFPAGKTAAMLYEPRGLGSGWRFDFMPELHIQSGFASTQTVTLHWPDGSSYDFRRNVNGAADLVSWTAYAGLPHSELRVSLVGSWPSNLADVEKYPTQWKVVDPESTVWILQTFNTLDEAPTAMYRVGQPISRTTRDGYAWTYTYGTHNELTTITDSSGRTMGFTWLMMDPTGYPGGSGMPIIPQAISTISLPDGTSLEYSYGQRTTALVDFPPPDFLVNVQHLDAALAVVDSTQYHHEDTDYPTCVTGITDGRGVRAWNFAYDSGGRAISSARAGGVDGNTVAYTPYNVNPPTRTVTNSLGRQSVYRYNSTSATRLVGVDGVASTNCPADSSSISYSSSGFISSRTDQEGRVTSYVRDARGRPTQITEAAGTSDERITTMTWHAALDLPLTVTRPGLTTTYDYSATGALTNKTQTDTTTQTVPYSTNGQTRIWTYTYTPAGLLDVIDGPLPGAVDTIDYDYDSSGYLSQVTDQVGHVTQIVSVNGRGQPTGILDPNGAATTIEYDDLGRVTAIIRDPGPSQAVTGFEYDGAGDITKITRPDGAYLQYTYDDAQRVTTIGNNLGEEIVYTYNLEGEPSHVDVKSSTGSIMMTRSAVYDEIGRLLKTIGADLQETRFGYDKVDNQTSVIDPRNNLWGYTFDRLNRLKSQTAPDTAVTQYTRNAYDDVTEVQDAMNLSTAYVRNGFGDVIRQTSPDTGITDYVVNALGLVTSATDARGVVTEYAYDGLGRVLSKTFPAASNENVTYDYDDTTGGNYGVGRLTNVTDESGSSAYLYDGLGRIVEVEQTIAGHALVTGYQYDAMNRVTSVTYPFGRVVTYLRDATGRVTGITTQSDSLATPQAVTSDITYLPFYPAELFADGAAAPSLDMPHLAGVTGLTHASGLALLLNYDADGRLTDMVTADGLTQVQDLTLTYDDGANITGIADNLNSANSQVFGYDAVGRLAAASGSYGEIDYTYDLVGNRTHRTIDDGTVTDEAYAYDAGSHRLASVTAGANVRSFGYTDAGSTAGDTRSGTALSFAYSNSGRLRTVTAEAGPLASREYEYDALQHRVREVYVDRIGQGPGLQSWVRSYVYDLAGHLLAEYATLGLSSSVVREYIWLGATPVAMVDHTMTGSPLLAIHTDHLGRPQKLTDASQAVVWEGHFDPFGEEHAVAGTADIPLRFPGQEWDAAAGLSQNWNRDYDPTLGRYIESDPIGLAGGVNTYAYAYGMPVATVDRTGTLAFGPWLTALCAAVVAYNVYEMADILLDAFAEYDRRSKEEKACRDNKDLDEIQQMEELQRIMRQSTLNLMQIRARLNEPGVMAALGVFCGLASGLR